MNLHFTTILEKLAATGAPDLILVTNEPPFVRHKNGSVEPLIEGIHMEAADIEKILIDLAGEPALIAFNAHKELETSFEQPGIGRFRATFYQELKGPALALRRIPFEIPSPSVLDIPQNIQDLVLRHDGLILITGPNGHGKSTTLASLIDHINANRAAHIVTIEDPIEFIYKRKKAVISQRAVGTNTKSFDIAIRHTLRQNVDVIMIGEMRDLETIQTALTLAETGHLVLATLHTHDAPRAIERIIDVFPADQQDQIALQLSHSLTAILSQRLIPAANGDDRVCAREVLIANDGVRHAIRSKRISEIYSQIQVGREQGMILFDDSVMQLAKEGKITPEEAVLNAHDAKQMKDNLRAIGANI